MGDGSLTVSACEFVDVTRDRAGVEDGIDPGSLRDATGHAPVGKGEGGLPSEQPERDQEIKSFHIVNAALQSCAFVEVRSKKTRPQTVYEMKMIAFAEGIDFDENARKQPLTMPCSLTVPARCTWSTNSSDVGTMRTPAPLSPVWSLVEAEL